MAHQLVDPHLHDGCLVLVAAAALVPIALEALKVLAAGGVVKDDGRAEYFLLIVLRVGVRVGQVAKEVCLDGRM